MPPDFPGGRGPRGFGPGGPGNRAPQQIAARFDANKDGRLDRQERDAARQWLAENGGGRRGGPGGGPGGRGRRGGRGMPSPGMPSPGMPGPGMGDAEPGRPGPKLQPADVEQFRGRDLYDQGVLRTLFLTFERDDWESELEAFYNTDVEVPCQLQVDNSTLRDVGVRFRGNSSFFGVPTGSKRSLNLSIDAVHGQQRLLGYKTLNLLNAHEDPSFLHEALHAAIGRQFTAVPQSNLVRVVVNGECWGVYCNTQQVNKDWFAEAFGSRKGAHWKVPPEFGGSAALVYQGDDVERYRRLYEAKSGVDDQAWQRLIALCRLLAEADDAELQRELPSMLDIDGAAWFLALDNALLDGDGYLSRGSDYGLFLDQHGVFHVFPYDSNEVLGGGGPGRGRRGPPGQDGRGGQGLPGGEPPDGGDRRGPPGFDGGRGMRRGGPMGANPNQGVLAGAEDQNRPLCRRLLSVPQWPGALPRPRSQPVRQPRLGTARADRAKAARADRRCRAAGHAQAVLQRSVRPLGRGAAADGRAAAEAAARRSAAGRRLAAAAARRAARADGRRWQAAARSRRARQGGGDDAVRAGAAAGAVRRRADAAAGRRQLHRRDAGVCGRRTDPLLRRGARRRRPARLRAGRRRQRRRRAPVREVAAG